MEADIFINYIFCFREISLTDIVCLLERLTVNFVNVENIFTFILIFINLLIYFYFY